MAKRFVDTLMWDDPWFQELKPINKCLWKYICDRCDNSGVWKINKRLAEFQIGGSIDWDSIPAIFNPRIVSLNQEKWFIVKFIEFQYGVLSESCKPHKKIFELLSLHGIKYPVDFGAYPLATLSLPLRKGMDTLVDKDKEKEEEKDKESINKTPFEVAFDSFRAMRKKIKKPMTARAEELIVMELNKITTDKDEQILILEQSERNCWQDVYPLKNGFKNERRDGQTKQHNSIASEYNDI